MNLQYTSQYREWLKWLTEERHISLQVIEESGLFMNYADLSIPVRDIDGKLLFYKHRRSFKTDKGIKYRYDKGAKAALFGAETLKEILIGSTVICTESELDSLSLRSIGYNAVSTTGGAGTWREEWNALLDGFNIVILYDADKAGILGAIRVASMVPNAKIAWLPVQYGKDPTEVIHSGNIDSLKRSIDDAKMYYVPSQNDTLRLEALKRLQKVLLNERRDCLADSSKTPFHIDIVLSWVEEEIEGEKKIERTVNKGVDMGTEIERARTFPIKNLIKVRKDGFAICLFHKEKTPSMKVYTDHAYCFGSCSKRYDAIDIFMQINGCSFKEAIKQMI